MLDLISEERLATLLSLDSMVQMLGLWDQVTLLAEELFIYYLYSGDNLCKTLPTIHLQYKVGLGGVGVRGGTSERQ